MYKENAAVKACTDSLNYVLDIFAKIPQTMIMRMIKDNTVRYVDDPQSFLLKAVLEQAVVDLVQPNQYVDEEARTTARRLISSCVLDELVESSGLNICPSLIRQKLKIKRDRKSDYYYGVRGVLVEQDHDS
jgi:hypothetical protein